MSWPKLSDCIRYVDLSYFQNQGWPLHKPFDVDVFCAENPEVELAIVRFIWPGGAPDRHYAHYHDGFQRNGVWTAGYGWGNPTKTVTAVMEDWRAALGDRVPPLVARDWEEASTFTGVSDRAVTDHMKAMVQACPVAFPSVEAWLDYSRGRWIDDRVLAGPWFQDLDWWLAHWIYPPNLGRQAYGFAETDPLLPVGNDFTPYRGQHVAQKAVKAWQISSWGKLNPFPRIDFGYALRSYVEPVFTGQAPEPDPEPDPVPVEVRVPAGKVTVTVKEF